MGIYGNMWEHVGICGNTWEFVGNMWECVGICGNVWECVGICGERTRGVDLLFARVRFAWEVSHLRLKMAISHERVEISFWPGAFYACGAPV